MLFEAARHHPRQTAGARGAAWSELPALLAAFAALAVMAWAGAALAQPGGDAAAGVPGFWDPRRRPERPDLTRISIIRFLTETDYPPFNYPGSDGNPAGFNV